MRVRVIYIYTCVCVREGCVHDEYISLARRGRSSSLAGEWRFARAREIGDEWYSSFRGTISLTRGITSALSRFARARGLRSESSGSSGSCETRERPCATTHGLKERRRVYTNEGRKLGHTLTHVSAAAHIRARYYFVRALFHRALCAVAWSSEIASSLAGGAV